MAEQKNEHFQSFGGLAILDYNDTVYQDLTYNIFNGGQTLKRHLGINFTDKQRWHTTQPSNHG